MELYVTTRDEWRQWLSMHHSTEEDVWLVYYKKGSGRKRIPYDDAVEEALCYGWIDGKIKRINEDYFIQRFTPRRKGSRWSRYNIDRVEKMLKDGRMEPAGLFAFREVLENPALIYENRADGDPETPDDLISALNRTEIALANFNNFPQSSRRMYIEWLNSAKRDDTRLRRIEKIVKLSEQNIRPGMNVI